MYFIYYIYKICVAENRNVLRCVGETIVTCKLYLCIMTSTSKLAAG